MFLQNLSFNSKFNISFALRSLYLNQKLVVWKSKALFNSFDFIFQKLETSKLLKKVSE